MPSLTFVTPALPAKPITRTALLLASLREFAGQLAEYPVWVLYPESQGAFKKEETTTLKEFGAKLIPYQVDKDVLSFPLGAKVQAAAAAEKLARGKKDILVWLDVDTLILSPPEEFILQDGNALAYRPVHHQLLGTSWGEEPDEFWRMVYQHAGADPEQDFQMLTHAGERIRPYFNAGSYAVRPERGILEGWWKNFQACYQAPEFRSFYERNSLYAVFMHQAIFTGTIQNMISEYSLQALSSSYNYPLHLHGDVPEDLRPGLIDELVTLRYENLFDQPDWQETLPFSEELAGWITAQLVKFNFPGDQA